MAGYPSVTDRSRRSVLHLGTVAGLGALAGCVSFGNSDGIDIEVRNDDAETRTLTVTASGDFEPTAEAATLVPDETELLEDMVPVLDYDHTFAVEVVLEGSVVASERYVLRDIPSEDDPFRIVVRSSDEVVLDIPEPTPSATPEAREAPF